MIVSAETKKRISNRRDAEVSVVCSIQRACNLDLDRLNRQERFEATNTGPKGEGQEALS